MGTVLNIQRFCTEDGPGIRTTVFLKGCPLSCAWCHNPESQKNCPELLYDKSQCVNCLRCVGRCQNGCHTQKDGIHIFDAERCIACGACISPLCTALLLSGKEMSPGEVLDEVRRDIPFYENSGGGMTLSGGEALIQGAFALELLSGAKQEGIHTAVETCGFVGKAVWERALMYTDLYLFDCKETNPALHLKYTGAPLLPILENLRLLDERGKRIILRCPIIPTINDREDHFTEIAALANRFSSIEEIVVLPYHTLGVSKYERLRLAYTLSEISPPTEEEILSWIETISAHTETPVKKA